MSEEAANVSPTRTLTSDQVGDRCFAAARGLFWLIEKLEADDKEARASETSELKDATQAYRSILRDEDVNPERLKPGEGKRMYLEAREGLLARDELAEEQKAAKQARKRKLARVETAYREVMSTTRDPNQTGLFDANDTTGLGVISPETRSMVYTALMAIDDDGQAKLDEVQRALLADLGQVGLEAVDLGIEAAEAIENDTAPTNDDEGAGTLTTDSLAANELPF